MTLWLTMFGMGAVTFLVRVTPFFTVERVRLPEPVQRGLAFVPVSILSAIVAQEVLAPGGNHAIEFGNTRILAVLVAGVVAWRTKNVFATVTVGMAVLWLANWVA